MDNNNIILIIDDNDLNADMAQVLLNQAGFETLLAQDADTGIHLAEHHHPTGILMDMYMPHKDGYEATRLLKANPKTSDIPIIAFTALAMPEEQQQAREAGCVSIISKPIDVEHFVDTVKAALTLSSIVCYPENILQPSCDISSQKVSNDRADITNLDIPDLDEWLMALSHDLQAPIRKIQRFNDFLKKSEPLSQANMEFVEGIERNANQLQEVLRKALIESPILVQSIKEKSHAEFVG